MIFEDVWLFSVIIVSLTLERCFGRLKLNLVIGSASCFYCTVYVVKPATLGTCGLQAMLRTRNREFRRKLYSSERFYLFTYVEVYVQVRGYSLV